MKATKTIRLCFGATMILGAATACGGKESVRSAPSAPASSAPSSSSPPPGTPAATPVTACVPNGEKLGTWFISGSAPGKYTTSLDSSVSCNGEPSLSLESTTAGAGDFGTLMTERTPAALLGQRVRLSGYVRTDQVTAWAGLWMRVNDSQQILAFDNMQSRPISGTTEWTQYQVVLDVGSSATSLAYGVLLSGTGSAWLDGVVVEAVDPSVPTTGG
jgi:hypothetical protein